MSANTKGYAGIKGLIERATVDAYNAGVPPADVITEVMKFEAKLINAYSKAESRRRFLERCREVGTKAMSEALDVTPQAIRKRRGKYLKVATK